MKAILQNWNFMRTLRLILGVAILVQGIVTKNYTTIILGLLFGGMAVINVGCCGRDGCAVTPGSNSKTKKIIYEELDIKK